MCPNNFLIGLPYALYFCSFALRPPHLVKLIAHFHPQNIMQYVFEKLTMIIQGR